LLLTTLLFVGCVEVSTVDQPQTAGLEPGKQVEAKGEDAVDSKGDAAPTLAPTPNEPPKKPDQPGVVPTEAPKVEEGTEFPTPSVQPAKPAGTTLVEAGAEPREPLRLSPAKGTKQSVELGMGMTVAMAVGTQQVPSTPIPAIGVVMDLEVESSSPSIVYRFTTRNARRQQVEGGSNRVARAVDEAVAGLAEARGTITISPRGETKSIDLDIAKLPSSGMKPAILGFRQSFSQLFPTFPEEPVGVGAKWKTVSHFETDNMRIQQTTQYVLRQRKDQRIQLGVEFEQVATEAGEQDLGEAKIDVGSYAGRGQGVIEIELHDIGPKKAQARSRSSSISKIEIGGGNQPLSLQTDLRLELADVTSQG
jgi:hypothetical protein